MVAISVKLFASGISLDTERTTLTIQGLRQGSTIAQVRQTLGVPESESDTSAYWFLDGHWGDYGYGVSVQWTEDDTVKVIRGPALEVDGTPILANGDSWSSVYRLFGRPWRKASYHGPSLVRGDLREEAAVYKTPTGVLLVIGSELEETGGGLKVQHICLGPADTADRLESLLGPGE